MVADGNAGRNALETLFGVCSGEFVGAEEEKKDPRAETTAQRRKKSFVRKMRGC